MFGRDRIFYIHLRDPKERLKKGEELTFHPLLYWVGVADSFCFWDKNGNLYPSVVLYE